MILRVASLKTGLCHEPVVQCKSFYCNQWFRPYIEFPAPMSAAGWLNPGIRAARSGWPPLKCIWKAPPDLGTMRACRRRWTY